MKKKLIALILVLVLCLAMCPAVYAANGDLTVAALLPGNMLITFSDETVPLLCPYGTTSYLYCKYANFPDNTNLSSIAVAFAYTGNALKINGTTVASYNTVAQRTFASIIDLTSIITVEVIYGNSSKSYYISAYKSGYYVKMSFEYENARAFSNLSSGSTYGTSGVLNPVTQAQKVNAATAVTSMDTMCESMFPNVTAAEYKELDNIFIEPIATNSDTYSAYGLLLKFQSARVGFVFSGNLSYVSSIGGLDMNSTGMMSDYQLGYSQGTGGWMYQVIRDGVTYTPAVSAGSLRLLPGDEVVWRYTCDFGYDIGCPIF